jgi:hypothetical protein
MTDQEDDRLMPEKTLEWLQAEALRRCRHRLGCGHLEAVIIGRTKPIGGGPNWEILAFKPELHPAAENEAMEEIHRLRGTYALKAR